MEAARKAPKSAPASPQPTAAPRVPPRPVSRANALQSQIGAGGVTALLTRTKPAAGAHPAAAGVHRGEASRDKKDGAHREKKGKPKYGAVRGEGGEKKPADAEAADVTVRGKEGGAAAVKLHMPEPPSAPSKATQRRIAGVRQRAGGKAKAQGNLPPAAKQVGDAQKAVTPPDAQRAAEARAQLIASVNAAPSPEILKLAADIRKAIRDRRPPDEDALVKAEPAKEAAEAGSQLTASVQGESQKIQDNYGPLNSQPQPVAAPPGVPLPPQPAAAPTAAVNASSAVPDAVPAESVSLAKDAEASRKQAEDAGMNKPAAAEVKSGPIAEAREAQGELDQVAKEDPAQVLAKQKEALAKADADMGALQMQALEALTAARTGTVARTSHRQHGMVGAEEQMRAQAGADAKAEFDKAQSQVQALLKPLVATAMGKWDTAKTALTTRFKDDLRIVKERIDARHSGPGGWLLAVGDYFAGLPPWAMQAYDTAENNFAEGVIAKLIEISTEVNSVIKACEAIIENARNKIHEIFNALPASLRDWAALEQAKFDTQFDKLGQEVAAARDGFNKDLTQRAAEAVDEVRAEISELRKKAGGLVGRIVDAVKRFVDDPVKFIIEGLLELLGISPPAFWAVIAKIKKVAKDIVDDPIGFANNLLKGIGQGFSQFFDNFAEHMIRGFLSWLFGDLKDVQVPKDVSLKSVITFFLQLMGITWPNIRKILAKKIGEKNVALIEKVYSLVTMLIDMGPQGIYEMIKDKLDPQSIVDQVVQMAVDYMVTAIAKQVAIRVALLFNPAGAILQAIEAIYRVLKWVFENAARIFTLIETIVNGLADIISGNVAGFAKAVERGLEMLIPPVLSFIADYFSLGDLPQKVSKQIKSMREWILSKIEAGLDWLIEKGKALLAAIGLGGKKEEDKKGKGADAQVGEAVSFDVPGESHTIYVEVHATGATLMIASDTPMTVPEKLESFSKRLDDLKPAERGKAKGLIDEAKQKATATDKTADQLVRGKAGPEAKPGASGNEAELVSQEKSLAGIMKKLYTIYGEHGTPPAVGTYVGLRGGIATKDQEVHHVPPKGLLSWIVDVATKAAATLSKSPFAEGKEYHWVKALEKTPTGTFNPGNPLSSIAIDKHTHIKTTGDPKEDAWRVHWGNETAKAVFRKLASKQVVIQVNGKPVVFSFVFIRRKLYSEVTDEDKKLIAEMELEAGEGLKGTELGTTPDAAGAHLSTQFFKAELWAAFAEAQGQLEIDIVRLSGNLGMVARGAAAQAFAAIEAALTQSKRDGSEDEKAQAVGELRAKASETWGAVDGIDELKML